MKRKQNSFGWNFDYVMTDFAGFVHRVTDSFFLGKFPMREFFPIQQRENHFDHYCCSSGILFRLPESRPGDPALPNRRTNDLSSAKIWEFSPSAKGKYLGSGIIGVYLI